LRAIPQARPIARFHAATSHFMNAEPHAELSSRYDPHALEARIYESWEREGYFVADPKRPGKPYAIVIPPPNVTGFLHIGHALNNALQDILIRWRRMQGYNVLWVPGTDHAGIATQHVVERDLRKQGIDRRDLGREKFLERVWAWKEQYGSRIIHQLKRLGCSCDWSRERFTMDAGLSRAVATVFKRLFDEGLIYRGDYLVNWSPKLQTALSDDEVVHKEIHGHLWHFRYPMEGGEGSVVVATTRPETMLGDTAVAVHPDDERYAAMRDKCVLLPIMNRRIPIIADDFVDKAFGTGAVKVTPAHDPNDYDMGKRHGLEFINLLNPDGTLNENAGAFAGLSVQEARKRVVAKMEELGLLVKIEPHVHSVGHCYRSDCVVEPYLSKQWFVKMRPLCEPAIRAVKEGRVEFVPKHYENIYFQWLENVRDWCISRQLWWGHRIPVFTCQAQGHVFCEVESVPERCPKCGGAVEQDPDVLDTWFSSQLWPFSTLGWPDQTDDLKKYYPTSVLVTGFDIIFFWVARMIVAGLKFMDEPPFSKVFINPIVRDEHGKKMSKSTGNAIDPLEVIGELGADTMRLAMTGYPMQSRHISLSEKQFERMRNFCNKLWNAARFALMNTEDLPASSMAAPVAEADLQPEDRWILSGLGRAIRQATGALEAFSFDGYLDAVYKFVWNEYCDWYLELVKDRLYGKAEAGTSRASEASRRAAQATLIVVLENSLRLLHPVAPFITEEIWQQIKGRWGAAGSGVGRLGLGAPSIMVAAWPDDESFAADPATEAELSLVQQAVGAIRNIRGEMGVPPSEPVNVEILTPNAKKRSLMAEGAHYLRALTRIGNLHVAEAPALKGFVAANAFDDVVVHVELPQALVEQERARLDKEIARLEKGVAGSRGKLGNEKFAAGAPEAVVAAEREKLEKMETELSAFKAKREKLGV
jgi:valyl-tRNA synthetase